MEKGIGTESWFNVEGGLRGRVYGRELNGDLIARFGLRVIKSIKVSIFFLRGLGMSATARRGPCKEVRITGDDRRQRPQKPTERQYSP